MIINDVMFNATLEEVFEELQSQLQVRGSLYFQKGYRQSGEHIMVQCPYHGEGQERKPSAGIRKSDGMFHCFACNEVHTLPEVISHCLGYTEPLGKDGWKWLLKNFATIQKEERKDVELDYIRNVSGKYNKSLTDEVSNKKQSGVNKAFDRSNKDFVTGEELDKYRYYHPYWKKRGVIDEDIIELFDLGYDSKTDCITFPVRDINGNCLFVARRNVKTKFFNYPKGVEKPLYGLYEITKYFDSFSKDHSDALALDFDFDVNSKRPIGVNFPQEIIICESMIDCILLWQAGFQAVALNGLGNDLQFRQLRSLSCRKYIIATDNDNAGILARKRIRANVGNKLLTEIDFPDGIKDIGECSNEQIKNLLEWEVF